MFGRGEPVGGGGEHPTAWGGGGHMPSYTLFCLSLGPYPWGHSLLPTTYNLLPYPLSLAKENLKFRGPTEMQQGLEVTNLSVFIPLTGLENVKLRTSFLRQTDRQTHTHTHTHTHISLLSLPPTQIQ